MDALRRYLPALLVAALLLWHALGVLPGAWRKVTDEPVAGRDFATYYYAVQVAADGGDPYDTAALSHRARQDRTRRAVHPYLYPPPFLLTAAWTRPLDLLAAYRAWFWMDVAASLLAGLALWRWWRPLSRYGAPAVAALALATSVPDNHIMGQANFPGLLLAILALWADRKDRRTAAGVLMGAACMLKMSPALFVAWWLLHRRWRPALVACATAAALSVLTLPLLGPSEQLRFYTEVLPTFSSGDYNGLRVPIDLFGNHSVPNLWHQLLPGEGRTLSPAARSASALSSFALVAGLAFAFRRRPTDPFQHAAQASAIAVALLLIPVYTYEHHTVWAGPAVVLSLLAVQTGRLPRLAAVPVGLAAVAWGFPLQTLKSAHHALADLPALSLAVQELKFAALVVLLAVATWLGARQRRAQPADTRLSASLPQPETARVPTP